MLILFVHIKAFRKFVHSIQRKSIDNDMKKILIVLIGTILLGLVYSCTSNQHCAAYGEKQRYQIERR